MGERQVAMVTGASRGIGRATAVALATRGFDLVITARSVQGGTTFEGTRTHDPEAGVALPGTLEETAEDCRQLGAQVVPLPLELTDHEAVLATAEAALDAFGRVDVLVDNAIAQIPGLNDPSLEVSLGALHRVMEGTALHPFALVQRLVPPMLDRGGGVLVHVTSGAATLEPRKAGVWGIGYAMAKAAAHKMVGVLHAEHVERGLRCYNLNPGHVATEVSRARAVRAGRDATGHGPEIPAAAIAWLVEGSPESLALAGTEVVATQLVAEHGLLSG